MRTRQDSVLLSWKAERVPAHGVEDIKALHSPVPFPKRRRGASQSQHKEPRLRALTEHVIPTLSLCISVGREVQHELWAEAGSS